MHPPFKGTGTQDAFFVVVNVHARELVFKLLGQHFKEKIKCSIHKDFSCCEIIY